MMIMHKSWRGILATENDWWKTDVDISFGFAVQNLNHVQGVLSDYAFKGQPQVYYVNRR